jgi:hypothetical protein
MIAQGHRFGAVALSHIRLIDAYATCRIFFFFSALLF